MEKEFDFQFKVVFDAIRQLMQPPATNRKPIGFTTTKLYEAISIGRKVGLTGQSLPILRGWRVCALR